MSVETLYWFLFLVRPTSEHVEYSRIHDAYVHAWASPSDPVIAEHLVRDVIREQKWQILRLQDWSVVPRQKYRNMPGHLQHFDEAHARGYSLEFYCWPLENGLHHLQQAV